MTQPFTTSEQINSSKEKKNVKKKKKKKEKKSIVWQNSLFVQMCA